KSLHEYLHLLQIQQFRIMRADTRRLSEVPEVAIGLELYSRQLRRICTSCRRTVARLPGKEAARKLELLWIDILDAAAVRFHDAIVERKRAPAQTALRDIRDVLLTTPRR